MKTKCMKQLLILVALIGLSSCNAGKYYFNKRINSGDDYIRIDTIINVPESNKEFSHQRVNKVEEYCVKDTITYSNNVENFVHLNSKTPVADLEQNIEINETNHQQISFPFVVAKDAYEEPNVNEKWYEGIEWWTWLIAGLFILIGGGSLIYAITYFNLWPIILYGLIGVAALMLVIFVFYVFGQI